jgi:hypothetical protein
MAMKIELNDEQQQAVQQGRAVEIVDPTTDRAYLVMAREVYESTNVLQGQGASPAAGKETRGIPPGILRSQQAFWRDLPALLKIKRNRGKWVCYHGDQRIGIAGTKTELIRETQQRSIGRGEYYIAVIRQREIPPWEPEEIEPLGPHHFEN